MGYGHQLVRRESGVYVCRFVVPEPLRERLARTEIRISTRSWHRATAENRAAPIRGAWRAFVKECEQLDYIKAKQAAPLFTGQGEIQLTRAAEAVGMDARDLGVALVNRRALLSAVATDWPGADVLSLDALEQDAGEYTWASVEAHGDPFRFNGRVVLEDPAAVFGDLRAHGHHHPYRVAGIGLRGHGFLRPRAASVALDDLWVRQSDVEQLRLEFVRVHAEVAPEAAQGAPQRAQSALPGVPLPVAKEPPSVRVSVLISEFLSAKGTPQLTAARASWKPEELKRNQQVLRCFPELMGDPTLAELEDGIGGPRLITRYIELLRQMPSGSNLSRARRETNDGTALALIAWADGLGKDRMPDSTVTGYVNTLSECFAWGISARILKHSPMKAQLQQVRRLNGKDIRDNEERPGLPHEDLQKIFGADFFAAGGAPLNLSGKVNRQFRPYKYWMPLLALYTGARVNELAQLYLDNIDDADTVPSICIQTNHPVLKGADGKPLQRDDQSLKTRNARREIPIHPRLLDLGFLDYVKALRAAGEERLFPELRYDKVKGYSKEVVKWFNGRFLGDRLELVRDSSKTFHSLRHNFATALKTPAMAPRMKSQLLGHERGEKLADSRYTDEATRAEVLEVVRVVSYDLPPVTRFDARKGLIAMRLGLAVKRVAGGA